MFKWLKKSKVMTLVLSGLLALAMLAGCANSENAAEEQQGAGEESLQGSINIAGSSSVQPLSEELGQAFMEANPDVKINVAGGGSSAGVKAAQEGTAEIGASSRELKDNEKGTVKEFLIARDGIAVIVHPDNPVSDLKIDDIKKIFSGQVTNWKEVGGMDAPITVISREDGSGTRGAFEEIVLGEEKLVETATIQNSTGAVKTSVATNSNAIGYVSLGAIQGANDVKAVKVDGVEATAENVKNGSYKISRPFLYLTKGEPQGVVKAYIDWVLSDQGQEIVAQEYIPVN